MTAKNQLWVPGDWNAFFGFGTNILVNLLTLTSLLRFVLKKCPDSLVFGRILPTLRSLMLCLSTFRIMPFSPIDWRRRPAEPTCALLPSGISVPHMFIVTFVRDAAHCAGDQGSDERLEKREAHLGVCAELCA